MISGNLGYSDKTTTTELDSYLKRMRGCLATNNTSAITTEFINLKNKNIQPNLEIYHILLKACALTADLPCAVEIIKKMYDDSKNANTTPIIGTYKLLLEVVMASSDHALTINIVKSLANGQIPTNHNSKNNVNNNYNSFLMDHNVRINLEVWKLMLRAVTTPYKIFSTRNVEYFEEVNNLAEMFMENYKRPYDKETWRLLIRVS